MARRRGVRSGAEGSAVRRGRSSGGRASRAGSRASRLPPGQLLLREDSGVTGSAPEDLGAHPVELAAAGAAPAAPVRPLVDRAEVPARHVAGRTLTEGMDARRDNIA